MRYGLQGRQQCWWVLGQSLWGRLGKGSRRAPLRWAVAQEQGACPEVALFRGTLGLYPRAVREPRPCIPDPWCDRDIGGLA